MKELYLLSVAGSLNTVSILLSVFSGFAYVLLTVAAEANRKNKDEYNAMYKIRKPIGPLFIVSLLVSIFCPSKNEMYMIYGVGTIVEYLQDSDTAKQIPEKTLNILNQWCDEYLTETNKNNN